MIMVAIFDYAVDQSFACDASLISISEFIAWNGGCWCSRWCRGGGNLVQR